MSKETAIVTPFLLILISWFKSIQGKIRFSFLKSFISLVPYFLLITFYLLIRVYSYGFATGDSYIWDFSVKKFVNTVFWYILWSFNIPETLVDFIGPGFSINPNLFLYWSKQFIPIIVMFVLQLLILIYALFRSGVRRLGKLAFFTAIWFIASLIPVAFLPLHKFTFYLTLPLVGAVLFVANILESKNVNKFTKKIFLIVWLGTSILTLQHTFNTNWITQGESLSKKAYEHFLNKNEETISKEIYLVDTVEDGRLPWSPTAVVKTALSDKNFFYVYFPEIAGNINYLGAAKLPKVDNIYIINSRQFLGY